MGKLSLLTAALAQGHLALVIIAMVNAAIAVYYYLNVVRVAMFGAPAPDQSPILLDWPTRVLCGLLIVAIVTLGIAPTVIIDALSQSLASINLPLPGMLPH